MLNPTLWIFRGMPWWEALTETAAKIYPWGPDHKEIWSRAGGEYNTVRSGDGRGKWHDALSQLRQGGGRKISIERLLEQMLFDYPRNEDLKLLYKSYHEISHNISG